MAFFRTVRVALVIVCALLLCTSCARKVGYTPLPPGAVVLAFGDSITHGTGAAAGEDFPSQLATLTGWQIRAHGVPGDTAANAKNRIAEAIKSTQPALVIVELGGNDFLRRYPEARVKEDLRQILQAARGEGADKRPVVLIGVPRLSLVAAAVGALSDAPIYAELAGEENVLLIDDVIADILSTPELKADPVHPNAQGYAQLAEGIARGLHEAGLLHR
jgi:acyl-CoA thioesterase I